MLLTVPSSPVAWNAGTVSPMRRIGSATGWGRRLGGPAWGWTRVAAKQAAKTTRGVNIDTPI
jgi:hypothetical protein